MAYLLMARSTCRKISQSHPCHIHAVHFFFQHLCEKVRRNFLRNCCSTNVTNSKIIKCGKVRKKGRGVEGRLGVKREDKKRKKKRGVTKKKINVMKRDVETTNIHKNRWTYNKDNKDLAKECRRADGRTWVVEEGQERQTRGKQVQADGAGNEAGRCNARYGGRSREEELWESLEAGSRARTRSSSDTLKRFTAAASFFTARPPPRLPLDWLCHAPLASSAPTCLLYAPVSLVKLLRVLQLRRITSFICILNWGSTCAVHASRALFFSILLLSHSYHRFDSFLIFLFVWTLNAPLSLWIICVKFLHF